MKDGNKNADADQYDGKKQPGNKITKYCTYFYNNHIGCERGAFCTLAHAVEDLGDEWFDRRLGARHHMVLCRFFKQGIVLWCLAG